MFGYSFLHSLGSKRSTGIVVYIKNKWKKYIRELVSEVD